MPAPLHDSNAVARFARWSNALVASPWAPVVTIVLIGVALAILPPLPIPGDRVANVALAVAIVTLLLVYLLEHNSLRDTTAIHVKLDEILKGVQRDETIGVEELPAARIEELREDERASAGAPAARTGARASRRR